MLLDMVMDVFRVVVGQGRHDETTEGRIDHHIIAFFGF